MTEGKAGDRLVLESEKTGQPRREGVILEVRKGAGGTHYRVRWKDGRESVFFPASGSVAIIEAANQEH